MTTLTCVLPIHTWVQEAEDVSDDIKWQPWQEILTVVGTAIMKNWLHAHR